MKNLRKALWPIGVILFISISIHSNLKAQSPADDPGIGGPGSPSDGPGGDGGPVVPVDGGMSLMLAASGIGYAYKKFRGLDAIKAI